MSITWETLQAAMVGVVGSALEQFDVKATMTRNDIKRPVARRMCKIDLTDCSESGDDDQAEYRYDAEIYFYPKDQKAARDECMAAKAAIGSALRAGILVAGHHIPIPDGVNFEIMDGVLIGSLSLEWLEAAEDEGDEMETLSIREEWN